MENKSFSLAKVIILLATVVMVVSVRPNIQKRKKANENQPPTETDRSMDLAYVVSLEPESRSLDQWLLAMGTSTSPCHRHHHSPYLQNSLAHSTKLSKDCSITTAETATETWLQPRRTEEQFLEHPSSHSKATRV